MAARPVAPPLLPPPWHTRAVQSHAPQSPFQKEKMLSILGKCRLTINVRREILISQFASAYVDLLLLPAPGTARNATRTCRRSHKRSILTAQVGAEERCLVTPRIDSTDSNCPCSRRPRYWRNGNSILFRFCTVLRLHSLPFLFQALTFSNTYKYARGLSARTLSASARTTFSSLKSTHEPPFSSVRMCAT
jgi:hypothetical protein